MEGVGDERWIDAWLALVRTHARLWEAVEAQMRRDHGLTMPRYDVLANLRLRGGRLRLSDLAISVLLSPSGLSKLIDRMESSGLIRREPDPGDARSTFAVITPRGRALAERARRGHHRLLRGLFGDALDDRDLSDLARVMGRLSATVTSSDAPAAAGGRAGRARRGVRPAAPSL